MSGETFYRIIALVPLGLMFGALVLGLVKYSILKKNQRILLLVIGVAVLTELLSLVLLEFGINNYRLFHFYDLIEFTLLVWFFRQLINNGLFESILIIAVVLVCIFGVVNMIVWQGVHEANSNVSVVISTFLVSISAFSLLRIPSEKRFKGLHRSSFFWGVIAVLIYYSGDSLLYFYSNWLKEISPDNSIKVWVLHVAFNTFHYLGFGLALWMNQE